MATIELSNITKRFGKIEAIKNLNLEVKNGEFFCVLGPPGAGKTTLLRLIVGLEKSDKGEVFIDGVPVTRVHPSKRDIAMIFQNLALYPDRSVFENIAYPLREHKLPQEEITRKVVEVAKTLHIEKLLDRLPGKLSGGERQRVAIGRTIVRRPKAYLMDEPLSNLDALLRLEMRTELKKLQWDLAQTFVYVTHDQIEAMSMADRIAVLNKGVIQQCNTPDVIYNHPANTFVASVVGSPSTNFIDCMYLEENKRVGISYSTFRLFVLSRAHEFRNKILKSSSYPDQLLMGVRPEDIQIFLDKSGSDSVPAELYAMEPLGAETIVDIRIGSNIIKAIAPPNFRANRNQRIWLRFNTGKIHIFDKENGKALFSFSSSDNLECKAL